VDAPTRQGRRITLTPADALTGSFVASVLRRLTDVVRPVLVAVEDVYGTGEPWRLLRPERTDGGPAQFALAALLTHVEAMRFFEWGDFYLLDSPELLPTLDRTDSTAEALGVAGCMLRCIDDQIVEVLWTRDELDAPLGAAFPESLPEAFPLVEESFPR
jgi:hypothetical protein